MEQVVRGDLGFLETFGENFSAASPMRISCNGKTVSYSRKVSRKVFLTVGRDGDVLWRQRAEVHDVIANRLNSCSCTDGRKQASHRRRTQFDVETLLFGWTTPSGTEPTVCWEFGGSDLWPHRRFWLRTRFQFKPNSSASTNLHSPGGSSNRDVLEPSRCVQGPLGLSEL